MNLNKNKNLLLTYPSLLLFTFAVSACNNGGSNTSSSQGSFKQLTPAQQISPALLELKAQDKLISSLTLEWLEPSVLTTDNPALELVTGRSVSVRAKIISPQQNLTAKVSFLVYDKDNNLLNVNATNGVGPEFLPNNLSEDDLADSFIFALDGAWVKPGVRLVVNVIPYKDGKPITAQSISESYSPKVGPIQVMRVTVVPFTINGETAILPKSKDIKSTLLAAWPLTDVIVTTHKPYVSSMQKLDWGVALAELDELQYEDNSKDFYVAFIPKKSSGGTVGNSAMPLGQHKNYRISKFARLVSLRAPLTADSTGWKGTLIHEMGHALNRLHSPCGTANYDHKYPFTNGEIGAESSPWGYDRRSGKMFQPDKTYDIMSYCGPAWVGWWSYQQTHNFLDKASPLGGY